MLLEKIDGLYVSLVDENEIQDFSFGGDSVSATLGTQDGAVCAPILTAHEVDEATLIIKDQGIEIKWDNIEITDSSINVTRNGKPATYKITGKRPDLPKRRLP